MRKKILFLFFTLFFFQFAYTQANKVDSLVNVLETNGNKRDTAQINILYKIALEYFQVGSEKSKFYLKETKHLSDSLDYTLGKAKVGYLSGIFESQKSNYPKSLEYFNESMRLYQSIDDKRGIAAIYTAYGITHIVQGEYIEALRSYENAYELYKEIDDNENIGRILMNIANVQSNLGEYDQAVRAYDELIERYERDGDEYGYASAVYNKGFILRLQGNFPLALDCFNQVLNQYQKNGDTLKIARVYGIMGDTYHTFGKYAIANEYHLKSIQLSKLKGDQRQVSISNMNIGNIHSVNDQIDSAIYYYQISLDIATEINAREEIALGYLNLGNQYLKKGETEKALNYYQESLVKSDSIGYARGISAAKVCIAEIYFEQNEFLRALKFAEEGKVIAKELGLLDIQKRALEIIQKIYEDRGDFEKALYANREYKLLSDSLINKEKIEKVAQIEYQYLYQHQLDSAKIRELELSKIVVDTNKNLEVSERKYLWAVISILGLIVLAGSIIFILRVRNLNTKTENILVEQKLLRSQMTPHFIFNSLSVLQGMILNKEDKKSVSYLSKFSRLLRLTLENSRTKTVSLNNELEAVDSYLKLQSLEDDTCKFELSIAENIDKSEILIPPMLIQPYIENSIEHAFLQSDSVKEVEIRLSLNNNDLECIIKDNGIGIDSRLSKGNENKNSMSTQITSERLKMLSKYFNSKGSVTIRDRKEFNEKGTIVTLIIPYIRKSE